MDAIAKSTQVDVPTRSSTPAAARHLRDAVHTEQQEVRLAQRTQRLVRRARPSVRTGSNDVRRRLLPAQSLPDDQTSPGRSREGMRCAGGEPRAGSFSAAASARQVAGVLVADEPSAGQLAKPGAHRPDAGGRARPRNDGCAALGPSDRVDLCACLAYACRRVHAVRCGGHRGAVGGCLSDRGSHLHPIFANGVVVALPPSSHRRLLTATCGLGQRGCPLIVGCRTSIFRPLHRASYGLNLPRRVRRKRLRPRHKRAAHARCDHAEPSHRRTAARRHVGGWSHLERSDAASPGHEFCA